MNKAELITQITNKTGLTKVDSTKALEAILETIKEKLIQKEKVQLVGFGSFDVKRVEERYGVNPQNPSEKIIIPARNKISFKSSTTLKKIINQ